MNKKILTALLILITVESFSESRDLVCLAAPNDGFGLNVSNAAFVRQQ